MNDKPQNEVLDRNGKPLKVGDKISILAVIENIAEENGLTNVSAKTVFGAPPDGRNFAIPHLNSAQVEKVEE